MLATKRLQFPRRFYADLDYAMHMPKAYVDKMKGKVPKKVYDNRFGAPPITLWKRPPDDYKPLYKTTEDGTRLRQIVRPWEKDAVEQTIERMNEHNSAQYQKKFFRKGHKDIPPIPAADWTIFPGDMVEVMVGKDKGKQNIVSHIIREENAVFVEGLHTKLEKIISEEVRQRLEGRGEYDIYTEQPLFVHLGQVKLVDSNDSEPCEVKWVLNDSKTEYIRVSTRTGYEIPMPSSSQRTFEYTTPATYIEVEGKDTPAEEVLRLTYKPRLCTFEQEIEEEMGLEKRSSKERPPTYWY